MERCCRQNRGWHLRREVIIAEDVVVIVVVVVLGEEPLLPQEVVRLQYHGLPDLEREHVPVAVGGHDPRADARALLEDLPARVQGQDLPQPLLARELGLLRLGHVRDDGELLGPGGEDHLPDLPGAAFALLLGGVALHVHRLQRLREQVRVPLGAVHGAAEELEAPHVGRALDLHAPLAALLDDLLQDSFPIYDLIAGWLLRRVLGSAGLLALLLLSRLFPLFLGRRVSFGCRLCRGAGAGPILRGGVCFSHT
mmetsp:Transcript_72030/g.203461  ORF Transcript_72030/g.203461 Transcript_72030/m.203461 type:complete len:253 (-) Transcript_72030:3618-4376(-)